MRIAIPIVFNIICAVDKNYVLGNSESNDMPWKNDKSTKWDMMYFKNITNEKILIMGMNTCLSIKKPLKNRWNIILGDINRVKENKEMFVPINDKFIFDLNNKDKNFFIIDTIENLIKVVYFNILNNPDKYLLYNLSNIFVIGGKKLFLKFLNKDIVSLIYMNKFNKKYNGDIIFPTEYLTRYDKIVNTNCGNGYSIIYKNKNKVNIYLDT